MMIQLNPIIPLISPKGKCYAYFLIDYSEEHHLMWVTFDDATGECWTWPNTEIRIQNNPTLGRQEQSPHPRTKPPPQLPPSVEAVMHVPFGTDQIWT
jgi:hypothetical protein